jgi:hypothetical protein
MAIQVIDDFLDKEVFNNIKNILLGNNFPWYYNDFMTRDPDNKFYFTHTFYREPGIVSDLFNMWLPVIRKLECKSIIRIKANNYCPVHKAEKNEFHIDYPFKHKGCLFYINNNNGPTYFKNEIIEAKANRVVLFDPSVPHASSLCDNRKRRVTVNFNYF